MAFGQNLINRFTDGTLVRDQDYRISASVRLADANASGEVGIQIRYKDDRPTQYPWIARQTITGSEWTELEAGFRVGFSGDLEELEIHIIGLNGDAGLYVDDVQMVAYDWRTAADDRIEEHRKRDAQLSFVDASGAAVDVASVQIEQVSSEFGFGTAVHTGNLDIPEYTDFVTEHFEWVVAENSWKWSFNEATRGEEVYDDISASALQTLTADGFAEFATANDLNVRGHAVLWSSDFGSPQWAFDIDTSTLAGQQELLDEVNDRINSIVTRYDGVVTHWDVVNEILVDDFLRESLDSISESGSIIVDVFNTVKELDPEAELFLNEFNVLNGGGHLGQYRELIDDLVAAGAPVEGIGFQSHFYEVPAISSVALENYIGEFTDLNLPLWITEFDNRRLDLAERTKDLEVFYRTIFSLPEVDGALMWGFWEGADIDASYFDRGGIWVGEGAALVNSDWTVNDAGQMFIDLRLSLIHI